MTITKELDMPKNQRSDTPAAEQVDGLASEYTLENHGLTQLDRVFWNLSSPALYEEAISRGEGHLSRGGPFLVSTGKHTARAAKDKFMVEESSSAGEIWWGKHNRPFTPENFNALRAKMQTYAQGKQLFVQDCHAGADPKFRIPIRIITGLAWHSLFARNMFITVRDPEQLKKHVPEFTVLALPSFKADPELDGTRSETAIIINFAERMAIITGSEYGGEIKKTIFTVLNYLLPRQGVLSMHCSANVGKDGDVALFFGLSGTGKTTLSADPNRALIGDDEHGWSDEGVFNFEGGCYAKVIRLSHQSEPQIHDCTSRFGTILENVVFDPESRKIDLDDDTLTENTRASYPLESIPNVVPERMVRAHPKNVVFLTCDAQGVLPPISKLNPEQAMYHFISGYTSKVGGTEIGLGTEPQMAFSACFGAPFMVHHPFKYANLLKEKMARHNANCWLVNTGWTGGKYGVGKRISIEHTRALLSAALGGQLDKVEYRRDRLFGFEVPTSCPNVPADVLDPSSTWSSKEEYWKCYDAVAARYEENFKEFASGCPDEVVKAGPKRQ